MRYLLLAVAVCTLSASGCGSASRAETGGAEETQKSASAAPLDRVTAGPPVRKTLTLWTRQPAWIEAFEQTPLHPKVTGYVDEVLVDIGDLVKQNQPLVRLWVPEMEDDLRQKEALVDQAEAEVNQASAAIEASRAMVDTAQARLDEAKAGATRSNGEYERWKAEHDRIRLLAENGSVTQKLVDETLNQFRAADGARQETEARIRSAQAALRQANVNVQKAEADKRAAESRLRVAEANRAFSQTMLNYAVLTAPFDGVVTRRHAETRHYVHPANGASSQPLLVVARTDILRVFVDVPAGEAAHVTAGPEDGDPAVVTVQALAGRQFEGRVTRTGWSLDPTNRSLRTEIDLPNESGLLRPGMYANVRIRLAERPDVLTLPVSALIRNEQGSFCCVVQAGKIQRRQLQLGLRSGDEFEIVSGISESDLVVLARAEALQQDQPVEIIAGDGRS